jgi:N-acetylmuramoyl-L-alanine amidase
MIRSGYRAIRVGGAILIFVAFGAASFAQDALGPPPSAEQAARDGCHPATFRVALDIGHYKARPGALSATGVTEFTYNLSLARAVLAALRQAGFTATFLIGESGAPLPLERRTTIAADAGAVLLVSLHHDSVQPRYLSEWMVDGRPQHYSDLFHGYSLFVSDKNSHPHESRAFARLLGEALLAQRLTPSLHHAEKITGENRPLLDPRIGLYRYDDLVVLKTAQMPAVLLESAIIVNRAEEQRIRDGRYHERVTAALVKAIGEFCKLYPPNQASPTPTAPIGHEKTQNHRDSGREQRLRPGTH